jgi:hypothetical protein
MIFEDPKTYSGRTQRRSLFCMTDSRLREIKRALVPNGLLVGMGG